MTCIHTVLQNSSPLTSEQKQWTQVFKAQLTAHLLQVLYLAHPCQSALILGSHFFSSLFEVSIEIMPVKALCKARERNYTYVNCPPEDVSVLSSSYLVCKLLASWLCELQTAGNKDQQHPPCYLPSPLFLPRLFGSHQLATDTHKPWTCPSACQDPGPKRIL